MIITEILCLLVLAIVVEAITEIITSAKITDPFRAFLFKKAYPSVPEDWPTDKSPPIGRVWWLWLNGLFSCGYCLSVWVAFPFCFCAPLWFSPILVNWVVMVFLIHRLSNWCHILFSLVKKGRVKTIDLEVLIKDGQNGSNG